MGETGVINWLLETSEPSVCYRTLTELLGYPANDEEVKSKEQRVKSL